MPFSKFIIKEIKQYYNYDNHGNANNHLEIDNSYFGYNFSSISTIYETIEYFEKYRFGFNGQEKDDEVAGAGNTNTAEFWEYDTRLGRRWNIDPVVKPWMSSYHAFSNKPISSVDPNGDTDYEYNSYTGKLNVVKGTENTKPDRIINGRAKYENGTLTNKSRNVLVLSGKIEGFENNTGLDDEGSFNYQTYTFSDNNDADAAYVFMVKRTDIEISKIVTETNPEVQQTRFYTSGSAYDIRGEIIYMTEVKRANPQLKLISQTHNHGDPDRKENKLGTYKPSDSDKEVAGHYLFELFNGQEPRPKFYIWRNNRTAEYDETGKKEQ